MPGFLKRPRRVFAILVLTSPFWFGGLWFAGKLLYVRYIVWTEEDRAHRGDEGLPSDARKWRSVIEPVADVDSADREHPALTDHPDYFSFRFPNGEWVFGIAVRSHKFFTRGGTLVFKDSRGTTRVYYGHVCAHGRVQMALYGNNCRSIQEFVSRLREYDDRWSEQFLTP